MTDFERALQLKEKLITLVDLSVDEELIDDNYYKQERKYLIDYYPEKVPICIKQCRNLADIVNLLKVTYSGTGSWNNRRLFIGNEFLDFLDFLEFAENLPSEKIELKANLQIENSLNIILEKELFDHIQKLLKDEHYFEAITESYKLCIAKIKEITSEEQAHKAFSENNYTKIFGKIPETQTEKNYFEGVKFLHLAIQQFRN